MSLFLCVAPHGPAFLQEGPDPLLSVRQSQVVHHHSGGGGVSCVSTLSHLSLEDVEGSVCASPLTQMSLMVTLTGSYL